VRIALITSKQRQGMEGRGCLGFRWQDPSEVGLSGLYVGILVKREICYIEGGNCAIGNKWVTLRRERQKKDQEKIK
jgi:hypothetical protein